MSLHDTHLIYGAHLATDGIPLHYGDLLAEYEAGLHHAILLDRSHEGRIEIHGPNWREFINRMSTNNIATLQTGKGLPTIFTNANGRILFRAMVYAQDDSALLVTEPGRALLLSNYLQKNIFFADKIRVIDKTNVTAQLAIHGPRADDVISLFHPTPEDDWHHATIEIGGSTVFTARSRPISGHHWLLITEQQQAPIVYESLLRAGSALGLRPAGSLTYHTLRVRAGRPAGIELSDAYIPLEVGLWDEVSFNKGCYTGQEIIARMESRGKLAKTLVHIQLTEFIAAPQPIFHNGVLIGTLTSSAQAPDGHIFALGVIKTASAHAGYSITIGENQVRGAVLARAGNQPTVSES